jgi:hypothetical protein
LIRKEAERFMSSSEADDHQQGTQPSGCINCYLHGCEFSAATNIKLAGLAPKINADRPAKTHRGGTKSGNESKGLTGAPIPPPEGDGSDRQRTAFETARAVIVETGRFLAREFGALDRPARLKLMKALRSELIPRKAPGRKRRKEITAAYEDWKQG